MNNLLQSLLNAIESLMAKLYPVADTLEPSVPQAPSQGPILPPPSPLPPETVPPGPSTTPHPTDKVRICALAQQQFEGWYLPGSTHDGVYYPKGSDSYQHNDPGNCRDLVGHDLQFPTYEDGFLYLENYIRRVATGKHPAYPKGGATTINEYTHTYTGDKEPSPTNYALAISGALGVPVTTPMGYLLS